MSQTSLKFMDLGQIGVELRPDLNPQACSIRVTIEVVTKETAASMLESKAEHQRGIKSWSRAKLTYDMNEGNWWFTGSPLVFDETGALVDGQHRLESFIASKRTQLPFLIVRGVSRQAYVGIDCGVAKGIADYFKYLGIPNANIAASAARWLYRLDNQKNGILVHPSLITRTDIEDSYITYQKEIDSYACKDRGMGHFLGSHSMSVALKVVLILAFGEEFAEQFYNSVGTGFGHPAAMRLHRSISADNKRRRKMLTPDMRFVSMLAAASATYHKADRKLIKPALAKIQSLKSHE